VIQKKMLQMVQKRGVAKSRWIAELIRKKAASTWPENVVKLAGAWKDLPTAELIGKGMGKDARRAKPGVKTKTEAFRIPKVRRQMVLASDFPIDHCHLVC